MNLDLKLLSSINNGVQGNVSKICNMPKLENIRSQESFLGSSIRRHCPLSPDPRPETIAPYRNGVSPAARSQRVSKRHGAKGANLVFMDAHAAFFKKSYITNIGTAAQGKMNRRRHLEPESRFGMTLERLHFFCKSLTREPNNPYSIREATDIAA